MFNHKRITLFAILFVVAIAISAKNIMASPPPVKIMSMHNVWQVEAGTDIMRGAWLDITLGVTNPTELCPADTAGLVVVVEIWPEIYHLETFPMSWDCADLSLYGGTEAIAEFQGLLEPIIQHSSIPLSNITLIGEISSLQQLYDALHSQIDILNSHLEYRDGHWRYVHFILPRSIPQFHVYAPITVS